MAKNSFSKNPLALLGLLGFLGIIGLFTGNAGFYGFFGFFSFFFALLGRSDELLQLNAAKAGLNAFVVSMIGVIAAIVLITLTNSLEIIAATLAFTLVTTVFTFVISFYVYEKRGV